MVYSSDIHDQPDSAGLRRRQSRRAARPPHPYQKFSRLEALESRLLFNTGLDPTFGVGGRSRFDLADLADYAAAVHPLPDGRVLVAGSATWGLDAQAVPIQRAYVVRLNADGSLDATFGNAGIATTAPHPEGDLVPAVVAVDSLAVGPDGRIFVGGSTGVSLTAGSPTPAAPQPDPDFAVAAFSADGVPDLSFGQRGVAHFRVLAQPQGGEESVDAMAVQPDGAVVATGAVRQVGATGSDVATVRFTAAGAPDLAFGARLLRLDGDTPYSTTDAAVTLQGDGRIVAMGKSNRSSGAHFTLSRYNADGSADASFGSVGGTVITPVPLPPFAGADAPGGFCDVLVQPDGSIVAAAKTGYFELTLVRYTGAGVVDASFGGGDGRVEARAQYGNAGDLRYDPADGSLLVAVAHSHSPASYTTAAATAADAPAGPNALRQVAGLARLSVAGVPGFSAYLARLDVTGHVVSEKRMSGSDVAGAESVYAVEIGPDGRLLTVGSAHPTAYQGEGAAWAQTADGLAVRLDPALFAAAPTPPEPPDDDNPGFYFGDGTGPIPLPNFSGNGTVARGRFYPFKLYFQTAEQARAVPVGLFGPAGLVARAKLLKVRIAKGAILSDDARPAIASYQVPAPGGKFDAGDNGQYALRLGNADPTGHVVGQFTVDAKAPRPRRAGGRQVTGVLRADPVRLLVDGAAPTWRLERAGRPPLVLEVTAPVEDRFAGERVAVTGQFKTVPTPQGGKSKVFVVTSIRAAAP